MLLCPEIFMRFVSAFHFYLSFPAMFCQFFAWLAVTVAQVFGNDSTFDSRYKEPYGFQSQIPRDLQNESVFQTESYPFTRNNNPAAESGPLFQNQKANAADGRRLGMFQGATVGVSYLPDLGSDGFEMTQVRAGASFGLPAPMKNSFFLLSPSFEPTYVKWDGPEPFPDTLYSASLGCMLIRKINERWSAMALVGPRWSSDGRETQSAVRCSLMGGMTWTKSLQWQFRFGVVYSNRNDSFNVLPFGGLIWTPNEDWKYELMAPMLRVSRRCHVFQQILPRQSGSTHWRYAGIGFGGGTWAIESVNKQPDVANYTEFSVVLGLESERMKRTAWKTEIGYVFGRSMNFEKDTMCKFNISDSIVLRATLSI